MKRALPLLALLALAACDRSRGMETRTFELARLDQAEAVALLTPYVRDGGAISGKSRLITVRETPDRLKLVDELLTKYDGGGQAVDVAMHIQVIEANGFTQRDPAIADVEQQLRRTFRYTGYRLVSETRIQAREDANFQQDMQAARIRGRVERVTTVGTEKRVPIAVELESGGGSLASTVTATLGKPLVLGQTVGKGAIILVIRPTLAGT